MSENCSQKLAFLLTTATSEPPIYLSLCLFRSCATKMPCGYVSYPVTLPPSSLPKAAVHGDPPTAGLTLRAGAARGMVRRHGRRRGIPPEMVRHRKLDDVARPERPGEIGRPCACCVPGRAVFVHL